MGTELRPLGVNCNIACLYCYQNPQRDARNLTHRYDMEAMKQGVLAHRSPFTLFGGEPLLLPVDELEVLWSWGLDQFGTNSIQTNGVLITDEHVRLFRTYRVSVGISVDGPDELNDVRWHGTLEATRESTAKTHAAIQRLCQEMPNSPPNLIVTLHQKNASAEHLPRMSQWFQELDQLGIRSARLHLLEVDHAAVQRQFALTPRENIRALETFWNLEEASLQRLRFDITADIKALLSGRDGQVSCVWRSCDVYNTEAVRGVEGNGQSSNCGRTNKDGIDYPHAESMRYDRYVSLYHTPHEHGGCAGCRFFLMCKGHCPGTAIEGDWRNRTEHCRVWFSMFERLEKQMLEEGQEPLSLHPRRADLEQRLVHAWLHGNNPPLSALLAASETGDSKAKQTSATSPDVKATDSTGHNISTPLPYFVRRAWISDRARERWEPRFNRLRDAWVETSFQFAALHQRSLLVRLPAWQFFGLQGKTRDAGMRVELLPDSTTSFSQGKHPSTVNSAVEYLVVIGPEAIARQIGRAWVAGSREAALEMLGVPSCCRRFAVEVLAAGIGDVMLAYAQRSASSSSDSEHTDFAGPPANNIFWRRLGVTAIPHWPCESGCSASQRIGAELLSFSRGQGFNEECDWLEEILAWPVQWTSLHGIAEFKSPILKSSMSSDYTAERKTLRRKGTRYPEFGARGIAFPYQLPAQSAFSDSQRFQEGLAIIQ